MRGAAFALAALAACGSPVTLVRDGGTPGRDAGFDAGPLPGLNQPCNPDAGCAPGGACVETSVGSSECFQTCTSGTQCPLAYQSCQAFGAQSICDPNLCGPAVPQGYTSSGPGYYAPCDSVGLDDGQCLPDDVPGFGLVGLCYAAGGPPDAGIPAACSVNRSDAGALCPQGLFCVTNQADFHTACLPLCAATAPFFDGNESGCATGESCLPLGGGPTFGVCLAPCDGGACGAGLSCETVTALGPDAGERCAP